MGKTLYQKVWDAHTVGTLGDGQVVECGEEGIVHGAESRPVGREGASSPAGPVSPSRTAEGGLPRTVLEE